MRSWTTADDVLVVGGGPAGSISALVLARAGVRVRILDRARFPRPKLCGDTVNPGSMALLDALGLGGAVRSRGIRIDGMVVTGGRATVAASYPRGLYGVALTRLDLDSVLLEAALRAGARIEEDAKVLGPVMGSPIEAAHDTPQVVGVRLLAGGRERTQFARLTIAADGRASRLASSLRLSAFAPWPKRWAFGGYWADVDGLSSRGEMHIRRGGYAGIAPMPDGTANVCVVQDSPRYTPAVRFDPRHAIEEVIEHDDCLRERFRRARHVGRVATLGPLAVDACCAGVPGLLLAGDAAGFVDPMTGDGLRFAIRGGELAAIHALRELESGLPMHRSLLAARRREFGPKWRLNRVLRAIVWSPLATNGVARLAALWTSPIDYLVARAGDIDLVPAMRADEPHPIGVLTRQP